MMKWRECKMATRQSIDEFIQKVLKPLSLQMSNLI